MRILLAVDIFEKDAKAIQSARNFLDALSQDRDLRVDVVTVVPTSERNPQQQSLKHLQTTMEKLTKPLQRENWLEESHILFETSNSQRKSVMTLLRFAENKKYDAIALIKHKRKNHPFLGSFAEMIAFLSPLPVLSICFSTQAPKSIRRFLIPLSQEQDVRKELKASMSFWKSDLANFSAFHQIPLAFSEWLSKAEQKELWQKEKKAVEKAFHAASVSGVKLIFSAFGSHLPAEDAILEQAAKSKADLIVLCHKKRGILSFLLGRVTRHVLQSSDVPVLLLRI